MLRTAILHAAAATGLAGPAADPVSGQEPETVTYKTVGDLEIQADVYQPAEDAETGKSAQRPVLVWIHGGALMLNSRSSVPPQLIGLCAERGFVLISIDYRLAPETRLEGIVADVEDALIWVRERGPELLGIDPDRLLVAGASAGGYLALLSGVSERVPRPKAILSYWGYGDIIGDWCTKPNPAFGGGSEAPTREEAFADIGDAPITSTTKDDYAARSKLFFYMKRYGKWTEIVSGIDPLEQPEKLERFCPQRLVTDDFPPLLLLHGTADPDVAYEQSVAMREAVLAAGGEAELITVAGGGHGLWGGEKVEVEAAFARSLEFIAEQLDG